MNGCFLGIHQVTHLFGQMYRETRLVKLEIGCNDLSSLNGKVLVGSIKKMKHLALFDTHLDKEIVETFLRHVVDSKNDTLDYLDIRMMEIDEPLDKELVKEVKKKTRVFQYAWHKEGD